MLVTKRNGSEELLNVEKIHDCVGWACSDLNVSLNDIETKAHISFFPKISTENIQKMLIMSAAELIDVDKPDYEYAAARLLFQQTIKSVNHALYGDHKKETNIYPHLLDYIATGISDDKLTNRLNSFDIEALNRAIKPERDYQFKYLGLKTIVDRYLIKNKEGEIIELPQHFWMRVAMGIALNEAFDVRTDWAIKFYDVLSKFEFTSSTPTLFNSGTNHSQMSSCYVLDIHDSIYELEEGISFGKGIFPAMTESALYSKFAGGIGANWTKVRCGGSKIKSTSGMSSGVIPYLKVFNDTAVSVNQGGLRAGSFAAYLEPWHGDVEGFVNLKKPTGDEHLRARDIFPYLWLNDLFMERVAAKGKWSLFCSHKNVELCNTYGDEFNRLYLEAEQRGDAVKVIDAFDLWKNIITSLVESGAPMLTFKDEHNRRNPQKHVGSILSSNLCSEISLNTSDSETAVCNLGSINVSVVPPEEFSRVIPIAMRMLDNVIDLNFYPTEKARRSNMRHRPVGLGLMGWTDYLIGKGIDWESLGHLRETDKVFEMYSYWAIRSSMELAIEKGSYESFIGSAWHNGVLPIDTARDVPDAWMYEGTCEWNALRKAVKEHGMRNSNCMAIAPTASIANIVGTTPCIEPIFKKVFIKENKSGKFKVIDPTVRHNRPELCKTAFEIDQTWLIKAAAVRQRYIDQSQSVNLYKSFDAKGSEISDWYFLAWELGLKSTYYLRSEMTQSQSKNSSEESLTCSLDNRQECESCQ